MFKDLISTPYIKIMLNSLSGLATFVYLDSQTLAPITSPSLLNIAGWVSNGVISMNDIINRFEKLPAKHAEISIDTTKGQEPLTVKVTINQGIGIRISKKVELFNPDKSNLIQKQENKNVFSFILYKGKYDLRATSVVILNTGYTVDVKDLYVEVDSAQSPGGKPGHG